MALGTFTLTGTYTTLGGAPAGGQVRIDIKSPTGNRIIDSDGDVEFVGPKTIRLDNAGKFSLALPTDVTTGESAAIGYRVVASPTQSGTLAPVEFWAKPSGSTWDVADIDTQVVVPLTPTALSTTDAAATYLRIDAAAPVATTGAYADLSGQPAIPSTAADVGAEPAGSVAAEVTRADAAYASKATQTTVETGRLSDTSLAAAYARRGDVAPRPYRARPNLTMVTTFQSGHGWSANTGTWTVDTAEFALGSQSVKTTTGGNGVGNTFRRLGMTAVDLTQRNFGLLLRVDQPTPLYAVQLYLGTGGLANYTTFWAATGGGSANTTLEPGEWTWVYFSWADTGTTVGTPNNAAITDMQVRVVDTNAGAPATVWVNAVAHFPKQTTYPNGVVSIAFDDNYVEQYTMAAPEMDKYGWSGTAFTIVEALGSGSQFMTKANLDNLRDRHRWEVGGHAYTLALHNAGFTTANAAQLDDELHNLQMWLKSNGYRGSDLFAYPLGDDNLSVVQSVGKYFTLARQIVRIPSLVTPIDRPLRLRSYSVSSSDTLATLQTAVDKAYSNGTWLVFTFHHFTTGAPTQGTEWQFSNFQSLMSYIAGKGMPVQPVGTVLDALR